MDVGGVIDLPITLAIIVINKLMQESNIIINKQNGDSLALVSSKLKFLEKKSNIFISFSNGCYINIFN